MRAVPCLLVACLAGCIVVAQPAGGSGGGSDPYVEAPAPSAESEGPPCMFDPADGRQKQCHHVTADGRCMHYGAACGAPASAAGAVCMLDPADARYKQCHHATSDGRCVHYGAACGASELGSSPCMLEPASGAYKQCHHVTSDGGCAHYGAACRP